MRINKTDLCVNNAMNLRAGKSASRKTAKTDNRRIEDISNICYKPLSFGRTWAEHKSWGAYVNPKTKEVSFKLFTFPDTKGVTVTVSKRDNPEKTFTYVLNNKGDGVFQTSIPIPPEKVQNGDRYYYTLYKADGETVNVKDPYSFRQESLLGESTVYDHSLFNWTDKEWFRNNTNRISRLANPQNGLQHIDDARIYELNTATLTKEGTFEAAKKVIKNLPKQGFNTIEIMPVENTYSYNWGYDGVDKSAPGEHLGGPDGLKDLIDYAHSLGLNVIMDMVPNHLGPDGASLGITGPYISGPDDFGDAFNYEGENSRFVRDYIVNSALNWLDNYHCDGLRLDMTKYMKSDYTMKQIAAEINYHKPEAFLIAEDGRYDTRVVAPLKDFETGFDVPSHIEAIEKISRNDADLNNLGYDSEWDFDYYHTLNEALYGNVDLDNFEEICKKSGSRIKYVMSHDEIGNFDGSRLIPKLMTQILNINDNIDLNDEDRARAGKLDPQNYERAEKIVKAQKAQLVSEKLAIMFATGKLDDYKNDDEGLKRDVLSALDIKDYANLSYERIKSAYECSFSKDKMAKAFTYAIPGPVMVFQGDETSDLTPFRFFREFDSIKDEDYLYIQKGYQHGLSAFEESKLGNIEYSHTGKKFANASKRLITDLNNLSETNRALSKGRIITEDTVKHPESKVIGIHSRDNESDNDTFTVINFIDANYPRSSAAEYYMKFPKGRWVEILSTDDKKYNGSGDYCNTRVIESDGNTNYPIKLAGYSTAIFKKISD